MDSQILYPREALNKRLLLTTAHKGKLLSADEHDCLKKLFALITATIPMKICSLYRCAGTQHQCAATLFRAKCSHPHC